MIKHFLKVFFASVVLISVLLTVTALGYMIFVDKDIVIGTIKIEDVQQKDQLEFNESKTFDYNTELGKAARNNKRFNVLLVGLESYRTDTIIVVSYDMKNKKTDLISIPRDTYYPRDVYASPDFKKINSIYVKDGIEELVIAVEELLGMPLEKYVIVDYEAVIACVDLLGGVEVNVPFHMVYSDPYDDPPLYIDIPEGTQVLNGEQSLKFLRYRKGYDNQDLGRIGAQQQFIKSALKKALSLQFPFLIKEAYSYIETNIKVTDILYMANDLVGFSTDNIRMITLPGSETPLEGLSFYIPDKQEIKNVVDDMYNINKSIQ